MFSASLLASGGCQQFSAFLVLYTLDSGLYLISNSLITSAKIFFPNKFTFPDSGWTYLFREVGTPFNPLHLSELGMITYHLY